MADVVIFTWQLGVGVGASLATADLWPFAACLAIGLIGVRQICPQEAGGLFIRGLVSSAK
jgi:hypothetical protein